MPHKKDLKQNDQTFQQASASPKATNFSASPPSHSLSSFANPNSSPPPLPLRSSKNSKFVFPPSSTTNSVRCSGHLSASSSTSRPQHLQRSVQCRQSIAWSATSGRRKSAPDTQMLHPLAPQCDKCQLLSQLSVTWRPPTGALEHLTTATVSTRIPTSLNKNIFQARTCVSPSVATVGQVTTSSRPKLQNVIGSILSHRDIELNASGTSTSTSAVGLGSLSAGRLGGNDLSRFQTALKQTSLPISKRRRLSLFELGDKFTTEMHQRGWIRCSRLDAIEELGSRVEQEDGDSEQLTNTGASEVALQVTGKSLKNDLAQPVSKEDTGLTETEQLTTFGNPSHTKQVFTEMSDARFKSAGKAEHSVKSNCLVKSVNNLSASFPKKTHMLTLNQRLSVDSKFDRLLLNPKHAQQRRASLMQMGKYKYFSSNTISKQIP